MRICASSTWMARLAVVLVGTAFTATAAFGAIGNGSLYVAGATTTPTHWNVLIGVPVTCEIRGVLASEVGGTLPATLTVWVKSSSFGNTAITATQIGTSGDYTFTYTPPAVAAGDEFDACSTTIVAYGEVGQNSNNDLIDDGLQNGSSSAASGLRFVDAQGDPIPCTLGTSQAPWSGVKSLYR